MSCYVGSGETSVSSPSSRIKITKPAPPAQGRLSYNLLPSFRTSRRASCTMNAALLVPSLKQRSLFLCPPLRIPDPNPSVVADEKYPRCGQNFSPMACRSIPFDLILFCFAKSHKSPMQTQNRKTQGESSPPPHHNPLHPRPQPPHPPPLPLLTRLIIPDAPAAMRTEVAPRTHRRLPLEPALHSSRNAPPAAAQRQHPAQDGRDLRIELVGLDVRRLEGEAHGLEALELRDRRRERRAHVGVARLRLRRRRGEGVGGGRGRRELELLLGGVL